MSADLAPMPPGRLSKDGRPSDAPVTPEDGYDCGSTNSEPPMGPVAPRLTARQSAILDHIRRTVTDRGYPPSMREIGEAVGLASPSSVSWQLHALVAKGYLRRVPNQPRAMQVVELAEGGEVA